MGIWSSEITFVERGYNTNMHVFQVARNVYSKDDILHKHLSAYYLKQRHLIMINIS